MSATTELTQRDELYHFLSLQAAIKRGDRAAAARAQKQLEKLGVEVRFRLPFPSKERNEVGQ